MTAIDLVVSILRDLDKNNSPLPASYLYNEGWMLRLILRSIADGVCAGRIMPFEADDYWTCEAKLATPFCESRGRAYEGLTNADGVIGNFEWRPGTGESLKVKSGAKRFEVLEAKMHSSLSKGVTSATWYDQAVRNVACMAHALQAANFHANDFRSIRLSFLVITPAIYIDAGRFQREMSPASMRTKLQMRISQFQGPGLKLLESWRANYFEPLLEVLDQSKQIDCVSWESLINAVSCPDRKALLNEFYARCIDPYNLGVGLTTTASISRGAECELLNRPGEIVHVCAAGQQQSRVFYPDSSTTSFLVENRLLRPTGDTVEFIDTPMKSEIRECEGREVLILSVGPCRSKVQFVDNPSSIEYVDNHRLRKPTRTGH